MNKYVKFISGKHGIVDLTVGKPYRLIKRGSAIKDDSGHAIRIMTPERGHTCAHLCGGRWVWCNESGDLI